MDVKNMYTLTLFLVGSCPFISVHFQGQGSIENGIIGIYICLLNGAFFCLVANFLILVTFFPNNNFYFERMLLLGFFAIFKEKNIFAYFIARSPNYYKNPNKSL
jgi:hypothetical protein